MKPLSQMTRDELWALDNEQLEELWERYKYQVKLKWHPIANIGNIRDALDTLRLELQQSAADAGRDTLKQLSGNSG